MLFGCVAPGAYRQSSGIPLASLMLDCSVQGALVSIKATQHFINETANPMECTLKLPLDENVAISELIITTDDGRVLQAKVTDKEEARESYSDAIGAGNTAVLGETKDEKEFEISVGNLGPGTGVRTTVKLLLPLQCSENRWQFSLPKWLMPKWNEKPVSVAQFAALPVSSQRQCLGFTLSIQQSSAILDVRSPTHQLNVTYQDSRLRADIVLAPGDPLPPQSHIAVEFLTAEDSAPKVQLEQDPITGEYAGLLSFIPPLLEENQRTEDLEGTGDFVLILDRSGSMGGSSIEMAKEAAILFIKSLSEGSKFNIVSFGSSFNKLFPESQPVSSATVNSAVSQITQFGADMGGTEILHPLQAVYSESTDPALPRSLYLLTDGQVENRDAVVSCIAEHSKQARVHAFGIGNSVDRALITQCAKAARGVQEFISASTEIKKKVVSVLRGAQLPAFSNLSVRWPEGCEQFPSNRFLPVCYFGECVTAFVRFASPPSGTALLKCVNTGKQQEVECDVQLTGTALPGKSIHQLWAKHAIRELTKDYIKNHDSALLAQVKTISIKYGVPSDYTAFLCVQENAQPVEGKLQANSISIAGPTVSHQGPGGMVGYSVLNHPPPPMPIANFGPIQKPVFPPSMQMAPAMSAGFPGQKPVFPPPMQMPQAMSGPPLMSAGHPPKFGSPPMPMASGMSFGPPGSMPMAPAMSGPPLMSVGHPAKFGSPPMPAGLPAMPAYSPAMSQGPPRQMFPLARSKSPREAAEMEDEENLLRLMESEMMKVDRNKREVRLDHLLLMDLVTRQEVDGRWLSKDVQVTAQKPADFPDQDLWITLCVMVFIEIRFAGQADEWQLVVRKARKCLEKAGVSLSQFCPIARAQLSL